MAQSRSATRFAASIVLFTTALLLLATTLHHVFASSRSAADEIYKRSTDGAPYTPKRSVPMVHAARPYNYFPRQVAPFLNETTTTSTPAITTTSTSTPGVPFGVYVTTVDGTPYTLTYVSTTATAETSVVETIDGTTTTEDITPGGPIWAVPTLPPGFPLPPPGPPPGAPVLGGAGVIGCLFGCGGGGPPDLPCVIDCGGGGGGGGGDPTGDPTSDPTSDPTDDPTNSQTQSQTTSTETTSTQTTTTSTDTTTTTSSTTTTTTTSSDSVERCSYECTACGFRRRAEATPEPVLDTDSFNRMLNFARENAVHVGDEERDFDHTHDASVDKLFKRAIPLPKADTAQSSISKREIPLMSQFDIPSELYAEVAKFATPVALTGGTGGGSSSSQIVTWDGSTQGVLVTGLEGCTSVVVVSRSGGFASHFWESPAFVFDDPTKFNSDVLGYLQSQLGGSSLFQSDAKVYIMTPAEQSESVDTSSDPSLSNSGTPDSEFTGKVGQIAGLMNTLVPGAPIEYFYYARNKNRQALVNGAYGKAYIAYSGQQTEDPDSTDFGTFDPPKSIWQVYMQGKLMGQDVWDNACTGNQKRQDNGACQQTTTTTSSSTPTTTSTQTSTPTTTSTQTSTPTTTSTAPPTTTTSSSSSSSTPPTTTTSSSSSPPPPPSCQTATANGAVCTLCEGSVDPACTPIGPPTPSQTSSNNKGSALCKSAISGDDCKTAYSRYDDNRIYNAYTSYTFTNEDSDINYFLAPFANDGCTAIFTCDNDDAYATGMAGWQIKQAFDYLYANDDVNTCGSSYLSNNCHVTVNGCNDCKDVNT